MNERTITVGSKEVKLKATAAVPRIYRNLYNRDIFFDFDRLLEAYKAQSGSASRLPVEVLNVFEDIAYVMAKHADPSVPNSADEWLDGFAMFDIYMILPVIIDLWMDNMMSIEESKKNSVQQSEE